MGDNKRQRTDLGVEAQSSSSTDVVPVQAVESNEDVFTCTIVDNLRRINLSNGKFKRYANIKLLDPIQNNTIVDYVKTNYNVEMPSLTKFGQISILCELQYGKPKLWISKLKSKQIVTNIAGWIHQGFSPDDEPDFASINAILTEQKAIYDTNLMRIKTVDGMKFLAEILTKNRNFIEKFNEDQMPCLYNITWDHNGFQIVLWYTKQCRGDFRGRSPYVHNFDVIDEMEKLIDREVLKAVKKDYRAGKTLNLTLFTPMMKRIETKSLDCKNVGIRHMRKEKEIEFVILQNTCVPINDDKKHRKTITMLDPIMKQLEDKDLKTIKVLSAECPNAPCGKNGGCKKWHERPDEEKAIAIARIKKIYAGEFQNEDGCLLWIS